MRSICFSLLSLAMLAAVVPVGAEPPRLPKPSASTVLGLLSSGSPNALAGSIRGYLVQNIPDPLYEARPGWGHTANVHGLRAVVPGPHDRKNDGKWKHITVRAIDPANSLVFDIRNWNQAEQGRITFDVYLALDARMDYDQQNWRNGVRLWSGGARARFRAKATLNCEVTIRTEPGPLLLPDAVVRLHVVHANVSYEQFVTEHINGVGGEMAELIGEAVHGSLKRWHPSLERDLLAKANAAIEKSADTKEVRIGLSELLKKKGWWPSAAGAQPRHSPEEPATAPEPPPSPEPELIRPGP